MNLLQVFNTAVDKIMKSQLLLEEDSNVLKYFWHEHRINSNQSYLWLTISCLCGSVSVNLLHKNKFSLVALAVATPVLIYCLLRIKECKHKLNMCNTISGLLDVLQMFQKLNYSIKKYFHYKYTSLLSMG